MKIETESEKSNPLLKRREYWLTAEHAGKETPSRHEMLPAVAKALGSKEDLTVLDKIFSERGAARSRVKVMVYAGKKDIPAGKLERQERKVKAFLEKKAAAKEAPPEEAPAGQPEEGGKEAGEKPAEEGKEEPQQEEEPAEGKPDEGADGGEAEVKEEKPGQKPEEEKE